MNELNDVHNAWTYKIFSHRDYFSWINFTITWNFLITFSLTLCSFMYASQFFGSYLNTPKKKSLMNSPFYSNQVNPFCRVNTTHRALSHSILTTIGHLPRDIVAKMFAQLHIKQIFVVPSVEMRSAKIKSKS